MKTLVIIDVQKKLINEHTKHIPEAISKFISTIKFDDVIFTKFKNAKDSNWVKKLGWNEMINDEEISIVDELTPWVREDNTFVKEARFSIFGSDEFKQYLKDKDVKEIYICGLDTHACVFVSTMEAFARGYDVKVLNDLCASSHGEKYHDMAIELLKSNLGKEILI